MRCVSYIIEAYCGVCQGSESGTGPSVTDSLREGRNGGEMGDLPSAAGWMHGQCKNETNICSLSLEDLTEKS